MNKEPDDIEQFLPYGEMLRGFMEQSFVGKGDLKNLLRNRGVFTFNTEKSDMIPILSATIIRPSEFDLLRETQNSKEDNPKITTQTIEWRSPHKIFDALPECIDFNEVLDLEFANYKVVGSPIFTSINGDLDQVKVDFSVERSDLTKNWSANKSIFQGSLEFHKIGGEDDVKIIITHTANETKQVASKVSTTLVRHFKDKGFIDPEKGIEKILFSKFSNAGRIKYLLSLTKECKPNILIFQDIVNLELSPDISNPLPDGIEWMERKIQDLKLNGSELHKTFLFSSKKYYDHLYLYQVDSKFKFDISGVKGTCVISVGFSDYGKIRNPEAEMEINIRSITFETPPKDSSRIIIKKILLKEIEDQKITQFKCFRKSSELG
jgi:hypothetical protein